MSPREQIQEKLENFLNDQSYFNAPYGIISGLQKAGKGKVRTVTFGVARYLDATICIWSPKRLTVRGQGGLASKFNGEYSSLDELIVKFKKEIGQN